MGEALVVLGIGDVGVSIVEILKNNVPSSRPFGWLSIARQGDHHTETMVVSGRTTDEWQQEILSKSSDFEGRLRYIYQTFENRDQHIDLIRYIVVCPLNESLATSIISEIAKIVYRFHTDVKGSVSLQIEAFLILPTFNASAEEKGTSYMFLSGVQSVRYHDESPEFDILWIINPARLLNSPPDADGSNLECALPADALTCVAMTIGRYLSIDVYREFNQGMVIASGRKEFLGEAACFSTLGMYDIAFCVDEWIAFLRLQLRKNILLSDIVNMSAITTEQVVRTAVMVSEFTRECGVDDKMGTILTMDRFGEPSRILGNLNHDSESVSEMVSKLCDRVTLATSAKVSEIWESASIDDYIESLVEDVRFKVEKIMDSEGMGLACAIAFLKILTGQVQSYTEPNDDESMGNDQFEVTNFVQKLLGWEGLQPSEAMQLIINEIKREVERIYKKQSVPCRRLLDLDDIASELNSAVDLEGFHRTFGKDSDRIKQLDAAVKSIMTAKNERADTAPTFVEVRGMMEILTDGHRLEVEQGLRDIEITKLEIEETNEIIRELGWKVILPWNWGIFRQQNALLRQTDRMQSGVRKSGESLIQQRERLLPCYIAISLCEEFARRVRPMEEEIEEFCLVLDGERSHVNNAIEQFTFPSSPISRDISFEVGVGPLQHLFQSKESTKETLEQAFDAIGSKGRLSLLYKSNNAEMLLAAINHIVGSKFDWLSKFSIEDIVYQLEKVQEVIRAIESHCRPLLTMKRCATDNVNGCLYLGIDNHMLSKMLGHPACQDIDGNFQWYSTNGPSLLSGLTVMHGITLSAVDGIVHLSRHQGDVAEESKELQLTNGEKIIDASEGQD